MGIIFPLKVAESEGEGIRRWRVKEEEKKEIPEGSEENTHHTGKVTEKQLRRKLGSITTGDGLK